MDKELEVILLQHEPLLLMKDNLYDVEEVNTSLHGFLQKWSISINQMCIVSQATLDFSLQKDKNPNMNDFIKILESRGFTKPEITRFTGVWKGRQY
ncbi:MAG TPA: hypothetical protein VJB08_06650 [Candidatus Nanoarchaeia archaeon]|nr:hypothetical protein [Candidatus Nanoarchaeia archaeon]